jgi:hypothetical protein
MGSARGAAGQTAAALGAVLGLCLTLSGCAASRAATAPPVRATVTGHRFEPYSSDVGATPASGEGDYYLDFEVVSDNGVTDYEFPVGRDDYFRYQDGDRVTLTVVDGDLRAIGRL